MPLRRRASLLSASDAPRRVCHETLATTLSFVKRHTLAAHTSCIGECRAMHTTPPRPVTTTSPISTCRWKRGRPFTRGDNFPRRIHQNTTAGLQTSMGQPNSTEAISMARGSRRIRQASATLHRVGLWNPAHGLRFAATATAETPESESTVGIAKTASSPTDKPAATTRADDPSPHAHNEASVATEQTGEAAIEDSSGSANSSGISSQSETEPKDDEDEADEFVSLAYQIPEEKLRAAMLATPNTRDSFWSAKLYQGPDGESLSTHYCKSFDVAERVAKYFLQEKVVGFDIEWKPRGNPYSIKQNVSLIQLACEDRIALFHVSLFSGNKVENLMPPSLKAVLESPDICKVGVAVKGDFTRVEKYLNIQAQGVFELSRLYNLVEWYETEPSKVSNRLVKLSSQVLQHLQLPLYKGERLDDDPETTSSVRESDWSLPLNMQQIHYAATDAYAGLRLYYMLEWKRTRMKPTPRPVALCDFDNKPVPRSKAPSKRVKKSKDVADPLAKPLVDVTEEQQEDEGDAEDYETSTEELRDTHQLEKLLYTTPAIAHGTNETFASQSTANKGQEKSENLRAGSAAPSQKRVGRTNLPWLNKTGPEYPELPKTWQEEDKEPVSTTSSEKKVVHLEKQGDDVLHQRQKDAVDEYADSDLEDALGRMTLDGNGRLTEDVDDPASEHNKSPLIVSPDDLIVQSAQHVEPTIKQDASETKEVGLSDFTPTSLDVHDSNEPTTAPQPDIGLIDEPSRTREYSLATTWAHEHLELTMPSPTSMKPSRIRATVTHLRAYHMWYYQKLPIDKMTQILRDPPLSSITVTNYILQAVTLERLGYEQESLRNVLLAMPSGMRKGRWRVLAEEVDASR